ncbi:PspC domain-containing protein [Paenibacillus popilliae]|uniref:Putative stress-responsive transcriptional regulator n=1 Tax=Paenibacillus popilliae ATCC 14706 TaxID=1212764 RepID=M9LJM6_PAEPP|nr:PspC domain-containing protein [Paenibacillus popilliae]GAC43445.1 putative stress-responsive transcriptional regulator [Paenibacillus popilliae ATCC 14706]
MKKKLYRSVRDRKICGVLGGIAEWLNMDATLLRVLFVLGVFFTAFSLIPVYFIVALVIPKEPFTTYGSYHYGGGSFHHTNGYYGNDGSYPGGGYNGYHSGRNDYSSSGSYGSKPNGSKNQYESSIDSMMDDIERKAMRKEIQELREKIAKYEKGDK